MQLLKVGSKGPDVGRVQHALNQRMLPPNNRFTQPPMAKLAVDNAFGPKTKAMVCEFQRLNGARVDGVVGPVTLYLLFPYIAFKAALAGQGLLRGTARGRPYLRSAASTPRLLAQMAPSFRPSTTAGLLAIGAGDGDEEPEGVGVDASVGPGFKREFRPWFQLKESEPEGGKSFSTMTVEATILRKVGCEVGGELEFSRELGAEGGSSWIWEGTVFGKYTGVKAETGPLSVGLSPVVEAKIREELKKGAAVAVEAEASLQLKKDLLELSVGGKLGGQWDVDEGIVQGGAEVTVGLKLHWEVVRFPRKKSN
ncbi:peptidoglycan-binding protein [Boseaceae bacterium BT-24-1]|nr:peptidoglycan-binding protein [Boseaceae bacterium BT-24-1]